MAPPTLTVTCETDRMDMFVNMPQSTPIATSIEMDVQPAKSSKNRPTRESVLKRLSEALMRRSLTKIDLSQRGLQPSDARLVKLALLQNARLSILKLGYNNLGDEGVKTLAAGISSHKSLSSLDLGFNQIGDEGCQALASAFVGSSRSLRILYLAGNLFGQDGALALADVIRHGCFLQQLHLTGNRIGSEGVKAIVNAVVDEEAVASRGIRDLFLGGTGMGPSGCQAVAHLFQHTALIRTVSLANCCLNDEDIAALACSIKGNRAKLPLEALQLSFNSITCKGIDSLTNAIWGSRTLRELLLDNNNIGDRGIQQIANILPHVKTLSVLDVGFNKIKSSGMRSLMKVVAEIHHLTSLSVSGNQIDTASAKAVAFALAYNRSLKSLFLDQCHIEHEGQRHIVAGFVSNSGTALRKLTGLQIGSVIVTIGFPESLEHWTNEQILNFIHLMWQESGQAISAREEESELDPLHFLPDPAGESHKLIGPLDATTVVDVAKRVFASLGENGHRTMSRIRSIERSFESPLLEDAIMIESGALMLSPGASGLSNSTGEGLLSNPPKSFVVAPEIPVQNSVPDPERKKRIVDWLCQNVQYMNELSQLPFNSGELWRLHQHYFTPVVNESGGHVGNHDYLHDSRVVNSVPEVRSGGGSDIGTTMTTSLQSSEDGIIVPVSEPAMPASPQAASTVHLLKRKVSYRFLGDATVAHSRPKEISSHCMDGAVAKMIEEGGTSQSMPPKTKRARRNRTRISFLPRVKDKLDSYLDVCHEKALALMRQLHFVEKSHLAGKIIPINSRCQTTHLSGVLASEAEMILLDMM